MSAAAAPMISEICGTTPKPGCCCGRCAVEAERHHALLNPRPGAVVDADDRATGFDRQFLDLTIFSP